MADQYKKYGQEKAGQVQKAAQGVTDAAQDKASQATKATKGMGNSVTDTAQHGAGANKGIGQSVMDTARQGAVAAKGMAVSATEQTGPYLQQAGDTVKGATQTVIDTVKSPFVGK